MGAALTLTAMGCSKTNANTCAPNLGPRSRPILEPTVCPMGCPWCQGQLQIIRTLWPVTRSHHKYIACLLCFVFPLSLLRLAPSWMWIVISSFLLSCPTKLFLVRVYLLSSNNDLGFVPK